MRQSYLIKSSACLHSKSAKTFVTLNTQLLNLLYVWQINNIIGQ